MPFSFSNVETVRGHRMGEVRSALNKAIRRGQEDPALYWATEIVRTGYEGYLWSTLFVIMSEDIGLAESMMPANIWALYSMWELQRKKKNPNRPERLYWAQAVLMLVRAKKSRIVDDAMNAHWGTDERLYEVPDEALDPHTQRGRSMGRRFPDFWEVSFLLENEAPDLPNRYTERAIKAPCGEFMKGSKPTVFDRKSETVQREIDAEFGYDGWAFETSHRPGPEGGF